MNDKSLPSRIDYTIPKTFSIPKNIIDGEEIFFPVDDAARVWYNINKIERSLGEMRKEF